MSLTLYLLLLGPLRCSLAAAPCKEEEYPVGAECCPKCGPGYRVQEACGELTGTLCVPCDPGTYTAHLNGLSECLQCRVCDPGGLGWRDPRRKDRGTGGGWNAFGSSQAAMGLVTRRQCSRTENTVCVCDQGHFCVSESGDDCAECRPHTACRPGQRVQQRGTEWQDRVCEDCPPETFSPSGTLEECQPWTRVQRPFSEPFKCWDQQLRCQVLLLEPFSFCGLDLFRTSAWWHNTHSRLATEEKDEKQTVTWGTRQGETLTGIMDHSPAPTHWRPTGGAQYRRVPQAPPDVTTVALEETASVFPGRDQPTDRRL
ncbi:tumor necrosis factor receptor superfamily member 14 isoform X2 [Prionailurus iriomotensis]